MASAAAHLTPPEQLFSSIECQTKSSQFNKENNNLHQQINKIITIRLSIKDFCPSSLGCIAVS
jgi:hypothetical protein